MRHTTTNDDDVTRRLKVLVLSCLSFLSFQSLPFSCPCLLHRSLLLSSLPFPSFSYRTSLTSRRSDQSLHERDLVSHRADMQQRNFVPIHPKWIEWLFSASKNRNHFLHIGTRLSVHRGTKRSRLRKEEMRLSHSDVII